MRFRLYTPADFELLYALEEACFLPSLRFPKSYLHKLVANSSAATWIAEDESGFTGFAVVTWDRGAAYIETIEVLPPHRNKGIGAELMGRLEGSARAAGAHILWLHVDAENSSAIRLYESRGYERKGREAGFYPNGNPALVYSRSLG